MRVSRRYACVCVGSNVRGGMHSRQGVPDAHTGLIELRSQAGSATVQGGRGGISCQFKFAVVNFAAGNFTEAPGFCVVNFANTSRSVVVRRALQAPRSLATSATR